MMVSVECFSCPPRAPTPAGTHVAIASGVSNAVTSPRRTRAISSEAQFTRLTSRVTPRQVTRIPTL